MSSLEEKLQIWLVRETRGLCESRIKMIPDITSLCKLTTGKNKKIWMYVTDLIKSRHSISRIKDILALRRALNEPADPHFRSNNITTIKREMSKGEEKVQFLENSYSNTKNSVFNLKKAIKIISEENYIYNQKCTFIETVALNYREKKENLKNILEKIQVCLSIGFSVEKRLHQKDVKKHDTLKMSQLCNTFTSDTIKDLVYFMLLFIEKKFLGKNQTVPTLNLHRSISEVMKNTHLVDFDHTLKKFSVDSLNQFEKNIFIDLNFSHGSENHLYESSQCLLKLKLEHVNSCINKKAVLKKVSEIAKLCEIKLEKHFKSREQLEYISIRIHNECLREKVEYLQYIFGEEQNKRTELLIKNSAQKRQCLDLKTIMDEFYQKLGLFHYMLNSSQPTFSNIKNSLTLFSKFIHDKIYSCLNPIQITFLNFINSIISDFGSFHDILKQNLLTGPLCDSSFQTLNFPSNIWKVLKIEIFHNRHLFCENLFLMKRDNSMSIIEFNFNLDLFNVIKIFKIPNSISCKTDRLNSAENILNTDSKKDCEGLKILLDDWWKQKAQFIPKIKYNGKTLKMWLNVLSVL